MMSVHDSPSALPSPPPRLRLVRQYFQPCAPAAGEADSDGEGEWVTAENLDRLKTGGSGAKVEDTVRLACATVATETPLIEVHIIKNTFDRSAHHYGQVTS